MTRICNVLWILITVVGCAAPISPQTSTPTKEEIPKRHDRSMDPPIPPQWVMGSPLKIVIHCRSPELKRSLIADSYRIARELDAVLSDYQSESALSQLNRRAGKGPQKVPPALYDFLATSVAFGQQTGDRFAITVGRFSRSLRPTQENVNDEEWSSPDRNPDSAHLSGSRSLRLLPDSHVQLLHAGVQLDPGGIAKGYAIDQIVAVLRQANVTAAFIDFGGSSFYGLGRPDGRRGWPVLLRSNADGRRFGIVYLHNQALSASETSLVDGVTGMMRPHIVDPRTGKPVTQPRYAVAIAPRAAEAEVLSTVLIVEPEASHDLEGAFPKARLLLFGEGDAVRLVDARLGSMYEPWPSSAQ